MNFFVSIEVRFLVETLYTIFIIARVRSLTCVDDFVSNESGLQVELFLTFIVRTCIYSTGDVISIFFIGLIMFTSMPAFYESVICTITLDTVILLLLVFGIDVLLIVRIAVHSGVILFCVETVLWKDVLLFLLIRLAMGMVFILLGVFSINVETTFVDKKIHSLQLSSVIKDKFTPRQYDILKSWALYLH